MSTETIAVTGKVLGALLYFPPDSPQVLPLIQWLQEGGWKSEWPYLTANAAADIEALLQQSLSEEESCEEAFQRLFVGPYALPAPPWGSVYLDKESVLFGDSTLKLREWMRQHGVEPHLAQAEPEDHIGLMLMMASWLAQNDARHLDAFLAGHLLPWSSRYLALLEQGAVHPFYQAVARLAQITLEGWQSFCSLAVVKQELYR